MKVEFNSRQAEVENFRYTLIAELSNAYLPHGELARLLKEKASRSYEIPYSTKTKITEATLKKWLKAYRKYGKKGLRPKRRSDHNSCKALTATEMEILKKYLEENPEVTATAAYRKLKILGEITSRISSSTLSRFVIVSGLTRRERWKEKQAEGQLKFEFFAPLECVQADCLHSFAVDDGTGKKKKALLIAFIDDATRRILYCDFSFTENSLAFEKGIKSILKTHGRIGKLYVDNGSTFVSKQTSRILDSLSIPIVHSRPYMPAGRGKIERFFRTVRDSFLRPLNQESITGITDLNSRFRTWVETEYNRSPHKGLKGDTPLDAWLKKTDYIIPMEPTLNLDQIFLHKEERRVYKDSTFTLQGIFYEAPSGLEGKKVQLFFDPLKQIRAIHVFFQGVEYGKAKVVDGYANTRVKRSKTTEAVIAGGADRSGDCIFATLNASNIDITGGSRP